ncbi:MAG TPA: hypothetical protein VID94_03670 [Acidimicrobiales bacterium]|jgi:hypothetical protein
MGFRTGVIVGLAAGYYLGAKAGRERYEQINEWIYQARNSDAVNAAAGRARELIDDADDLTVANFSHN